MEQVEIIKIRSLGRASVELYLQHLGRGHFMRLASESVGNTSNRIKMLLREWTAVAGVTKLCLLMCTWTLHWEPTIYKHERQVPFASPALVYPCNSPCWQSLTLAPAGWVEMRFVELHASMTKLVQKGAVRLTLNNWHSLPLQRPVISFPKWKEAQP